MKKKQLKFVRQGDLLIEVIEKLPKGLKKRKDTVILYGSSTGHSHYLKSGSVYDGRNDTIYLELPKKSQLLHDSDHDPIDLPKGVYQVVRQKEYLSKDMIRLVID